MIKFKKLDLFHSCVLSWIKLGFVSVRLLFSKVNSVGPTELGAVPYGLRAMEELGRKAHLGLSFSPLAVTSMYPCFPM